MNNTSPLRASSHPQTPYKIYTGNETDVAPQKPRKKRRKPLNPKLAKLIFKTAPFFYGAFFGIATAVYGFSGAALLYALGCYEKTCGLFRFLFTKGDSAGGNGAGGLTTKARVGRLFLFGLGGIIGFATLGVIIASAADDQPVLTRLFYIGILLGGIPTVLQNGAVTERLRGKGWIPFFALLAVSVLLVAGNGRAGRYEFKQTKLGGTVAIAELKNTGNTPITKWYLKVRGGSCGAVNGANMTRFETVVNKLASMYGMGVPEGSANALTGGTLPPGQSARIQYRMVDNKLMTLEPIVVSDSGADVMWLAVTAFGAGILLFIPGIPFTMLLASVGAYGVLAAATSEGRYGTVVAAFIFASLGVHVQDTPRDSRVLRRGCERGGAVTIPFFTPDNG
ncbi:hypothetical protein FACS1894133_6770 [Clostridia bacterium]|nr:hypothetical protein FACS1894133_6770 [Clostridia bacterium]